MARNVKKTKAKDMKAKSAKAKPKAKASPAKPKSSADLVLPRDLHGRLTALARQMEKTMDALMLQALCEFADAWEDHFRTVKALQADDRVQVAVKPE
ncbi:MAG: hypothetical protein SFV19_13315 [Rhodospirillaceae bacterium]|nr:hypothetical protein [Rhodospirillaceae bacterium]